MFDKYRYNKCGYTLMEMMIIVVVVGLLASMAVPGFLKMMPKLNLKADARTNLNMLRLARNRSVSENSQYGVYFDTGNKRTFLFKNTFDQTHANYDAGQDTVIDSSATLHSGVTFNTVSFTGNTLVFLPSGAASQSGTLTLTQPTAGRTYTITILGSTGKVSLR
jgi:prepilin-type N-terminal cleavage/methylation domain-containing protein